MDALEYYVMRNDEGVTMWLDADEKTWTRHFHGAAAFASAKLADDIAKRQLGDDRVFYVLGCCPTDPE